MWKINLFPFTVKPSFCRKAETETLFSAWCMRATSCVFILKMDMYSVSDYLIKERFSLHRHPFHLRTGVVNPTVVRGTCSVQACQTTLTINFFPVKDKKFSFVFITFCEHGYLWPVCIKNISEYWQHLILVSVTYVTFSIINTSTSYKLINGHESWSIKTSTVPQCLIICLQFQNVID